MPQGPGWETGSPGLRPWVGRSPGGHLVIPTMKGMKWLTITLFFSPPGEQKDQTVPFIDLEGPPQSESISPDFCH